MYNTFVNGESSEHIKMARYFILVCYLLVFFYGTNLHFDFYSSVQFFRTFAMSDLGVTSCREYTYSIAPHEICSPYHFWMNVLFIINRLTFSFGILHLSQNLEKTRLNRLATIFILILALGNIVSGFIPADINLFWH